MIEFPTIKLILGIATFIVGLLVVSVVGYWLHRRRLAVCSNCKTGRLHLLEHPTPDEISMRSGDQANVVGHNLHQCDLCHELSWRKRATP